MMRLFRHTLCLLLLATLAACSDKEPGYDPPATADRTVLLYMPGQSLFTYYKNNIQGIHTAVTDRALGNGRMLVCWQPEKQTSAVMLEIYYDRNKRSSQTKTLKTYDDFNAGDPAKVQQLLADAAQLAPARNYGLIIGCHGKAWVPASSGAIPRSLSLGTTAEDDVWKRAPGAKMTRSFGDLGYELDITELAAALEAQSFRFDYLIFDDCFMANIETLYDLRHAVDYIVASPCEVMGDGFPYDRIVPHLFEGNGVLSGLEKACWEFWNLYENDWRSTIAYEQSGCISLAVTAQLDALATKMRGIKDKKQAFDINALQYYKGNVTKLFYDLEHYVTLCCSDPDAVNDFKAQMELAFPVSCRHHTASFYSAYDRRNHSVNYYSGISVSEPEPSARYTAENQQTNWYRDTH